MPESFNNQRFRKLLLAVPAKAIEYLYDTYYDSLYRISLRRTNDELASADIVQEALIHVWEKHRSLSNHHEHPIQYYLVRIVLNRSISHLRLKRNAKFKRLNGEEAFGFESPREDQLVREETSLELRNLISTFPMREKQCLLMRLDKEMSVAEMAKTLKISEKAVERSITSANKRLRKYWENRG